MWLVVIFFFFFLRDFFFLMRDCQEIWGNDVISCPQSPYFRCAQQTWSRLGVLCLSFNLETQQCCKLWGFARNGGTYVLEFGLRPLLDHFIQTSKKLETPKPNHMITSGWTPAQLELMSNIAVVKLNLFRSWLSNKTVVIFVLVFSC